MGAAKCGLRFVILSAFKCLDPRCILTIKTHYRVAVLKIDDGKANVVSEAFSRVLNEGLDAAERDADAVLIVGCPGRFSAGYDLSVIRDGTPEQAAAMRSAGAWTMYRLFMHPRPVVMACTGHALAAGALILLAGDTRIGVRGDFKIGLNETAIGLALPTYGVELAKARMPAGQLTQSWLILTLLRRGKGVSPSWRYLRRFYPRTRHMDHRIRCTQAVYSEAKYGANC